MSPLLNPLLLLQAEPVNTRIWNEVLRTCTCHTRAHTHTCRSKTVLFTVRRRSLRVMCRSVSLQPASGHSEPACAPANTICSRLISARIHMYMHCACVRVSVCRLCRLSASDVHTHEMHTCTPTAGQCCARGGDDVEVVPRMRPPHRH